MRTAVGGEAAFDRFTQWPPDLVLTDLRLPVVDGLELCRRIRARSRVPVHVRESEVRLTPKEFELFVYKARHPNRVLGHRRLLGAVWGDASLDQPEYLRVFVGQLRKKLEPTPSQPRHLLTEPSPDNRRRAAGTPSATPCRQDR